MTIILFVEEWTKWYIVQVFLCIQQLWRGNVWIPGYHVFFFHSVVINISYYNNFFGFMLNWLPNSKPLKLLMYVFKTLDWYIICIQLMRHNLILHDTHERVLWFWYEIRFIGVGHFQCFEQNANQAWLLWVVVRFYGFNTFSLNFQ